MSPGSRDFSPGLSLFSLVVVGVYGAVSLKNWFLGLQAVLALAGCVSEGLLALYDISLDVPRLVREKPRPRCSLVATSGAGICVASQEDGEPWEMFDRPVVMEFLGWEDVSTRSHVPAPTATSEATARHHLRSSEHMQSAFGASNPYPIRTLEQLRRSR
jgi:hypothetical protein